MSIRITLAKYLNMQSLYFARVKPDALIVTRDMEISNRRKQIVTSDIKIGNRRKEDFLRGKDKPDLDKPERSFFRICFCSTIATD